MNAISQDEVCVPAKGISKAKFNVKSPLEADSIIPEPVISTSTTPKSPVSTEIF